MQETPLEASSDEGAIAVIGISLRAPGASDVRRFWANLAAGVNSVTILDSEQRAKAGMPSEDGWLAAAGLIENPELFDATFFGYSPREAEQLDPQHRLFLECAWEGLESAGYAVRSRPLNVGVYAGTMLSTYLLKNVLPSMERRSSDWTESLLGTNPDFLATRVAYKLNLTGPALTVQTACSTSLTAVHLACQGLLAGECDLALAGAAAVRTPQIAAYRIQEGGVSSPDGHCRAFDEKAAGTVPGNGAAVVVLKRLADALADGDPIRAVIRGTAISNDGSNKAGFTAPSVSGQATTISAAQALAGVEPGSLSYVEAHGTGTQIGDPIEVAALKQVFRGVAPGSVGLGSVKTNVGHLDTAAGVTGLIKVVLAMEHALLPPTLNFTRPNPLLELEGSPFYVVAWPRPWTGPRPLRAGVSSFGFGGTNAHAVLEEAPPVPASGVPRRDEELLLLSARSEEALERMTAELAEHLGRAPEPLADVAHTLQVGRNRFEWRRFVTVSRTEDAPALLTGARGEPPRTAFDETERRGAVFLFPGIGAQRVNMGAGLLREPVFREAVDRCAEQVRRHLGGDLREVMFAGPERFDAASRELDRPQWTQPALFTCEWALAQLWRSWGVQPEVLLGHSLGEYVAACLAGVFSLEEALELVVARGRLVEQLPPGGMTSVLAPAEQVASLLGPDLSLAAINAPSACVASGPLEAVAAFEAVLAQRGISFRRLRTTRAMHSAMMEPYLADFARQVSRFDLKAPTLPVVSSITGRWLTGREAMDPAYWCRHLRETVQFSDAMGLLLSSGERAFLELGPGTTLTSLAKQHPACTTQPVIATAPGPSTPPGGLLAPLGEAWLAGVTIDWERFRDGERRRRVTLPTYSFDRERHWIETDASAAQPRPSRAPRRSTRRGAPPVPPRNATEEQLVECFRLLFNLEEVGIHDDFFALGGDSLVAMRLGARIEERFGVRLPLKAVLEAPTVARLAERLGARHDAAPAKRAQPDCLVTLQEGTHGTPAFFVHAVSGQVLFYRNLARALSPERPVYGLEAVGLSGDGACHTTVEEMATHYLDAIRKVRPGGPYLLVGASFGGLVAYEMARRLAAGGQPVPLCAMLDSPPPGYRAPWLGDATELLAYLVRDTLPAERLRGLPLEAQVRLLHEEAERTGTEPLFPNVEQARRQLAVWLANGAALHRYAPPRWEGGELQYFRAMESNPEDGNPALAWLRLGLAIRVEVVPGDHDSMLQPPHSEGLGARLARLIP